MVTSYLKHLENQIWYQSIFPRFLHLIVIEFKQIIKLLFLLKSSEKPWFFDDFRRNRSLVIPLKLGAKLEAVVSQIPISPIANVKIIGLVCPFSKYYFFQIIF